MKRAPIVLVLLLAACTPAASPSPSSTPEPTATATATPEPTPEPTPAANTMSVSLDLIDPDAWVEGELECEGEGGYSDINAASQVVVRDGAGEVLATADLGIGLHILDDTCSFVTDVEDVPPAPFYAVEISHRGELVYSAAEMEEMGWLVHLTLGSD